MSSVSKNPIRATNLGDYMKNLSPVTIDKLYAKSSSCCLAIFGQLPPLAKQYVIRLLFVDQGIPKDVISSWVTQSSADEHNESMQLLTELRIWSESPIHGGLPGLKLNDTFKNNLQVALLGSGDPWLIKPCEDRDKHGRDIAFLDQYAMERWECVLHFMVGSQGNEDVISTDTVQTLRHAGLVNESVTPDNLPGITADGFQFLLMDTKSQVWYFLLQYLDTVESRGLDLVECLNILFQISFLTLGKDYSTTSLSESMSNFLQNLREFGLIYQRKRKDGRFYPTKLVINLTANSPSSWSDKRREGYIIVETNYKVFAYTNSTLQMALVALFTEMQYRLPNVGIGLLTRDSVRAALKNGITAEQIISFLRAHAHSQLKRLPPTVVDQIKLWEIERDRFIYKDGVVYSQFISQSDFQTLRNYANDAGHLVWENPSRRIMVVTNDGHEDVRRFWKRHKRDH